MKSQLQTSKPHPVLLALWPLLTLLLAPSSWAQSPSGPAMRHCDFQNLRGELAPVSDYRSATAGAKLVVERRHFTARVETLMSGETAKNPGPDLHYTLNKMPNHHRALLSLVRLAEKLKTDKDPDMRYSFACYFERALNFRADDTLVRLIYATYLGKNSQLPAAMQQLALASQAAKDSGMTHYNIGLVYADLGQYDEALSSAHRAIELGIEKPELRERLEKQGKWREPTPAPAADAAASEPAPPPASAPASAPLPAASSASTSSH